MTHLISSAEPSRQKVAGADRSMLGVALVLLLSILTWLVSLYSAADLGGILYFAPLAIALSIAAACGLFALLSGDGKAVVGLLFISMLILELSFREREPGESGLDLQNGIKLIFWGAMIMAALPSWHCIIGLLKESLICCFALAFCVLSTVSVVWSAEPGVTIASGVGLFAALSLSFALALRAHPVNVHRAYFWALAILVILACASYFVVPSIALLPPSEGEGEYRLQGFSGHPNLLGQQAAVLLLMLVAMWEENAVARVWLVPIGLAGAAALFFSESRTSLAGVVVALAVVRLREARLLKPVLLAALALAATVAFLAATDMMPNIAEHLSGLTRSGSASELTTFTGRTELWDISWERFLQKPWFGWGYNANERLMMDSVGPNFAGNAVNSHNMFLQALVTIGVVGTAIVFAFIGGMARNMIVRPNALRDRIFVYLMVLGIAEAEFLTLPVLTIYLAFWAIADAVVEGRGQTR